MDASVSDSWHSVNSEAQNSNGIGNSNLSREIQQVSSFEVDIKQEYSSEVCQNQEDLSATMTELPIESEIWIEDFKIEQSSDSDELVEPITSNDTDKREEPSSSDDDSYEELPPKKSQSRQASELLTEHYGLPCSLCGATMKSFYQIGLHFRKRHNRRYAYVVCCDRKFNRKRHLMDHFREESHEISPCVFCNVKYMSPQVLSTHLSEGEGRYTCKECPTSFKQKCAFDVHKIRHWAFRCSECVSVFKNRDKLLSHMNLKHNGADRSIKCETCDRKFQSKKTLISHRSAQHSGTGMLRCEVCQLWLKTKETYKRHMEHIHGPSKKIACEICQKEFSYKRGLLNHKRNVHVEEMYGCDLCDKKFKRRTTLVEHRTRHKGAKALHCEFCSYKTINRSRLYVHTKKCHPEEWAEKRLKRGLKPTP